MMCYVFVNGGAGMLRIAEARLACGWSQEQLAEAIGTTQQTIQRWESGQIDPKVSKIQAISAALGVTVSELMGMTEDAEDSQLTLDEQRLLDAYRAADDNGKAYLMQTAAFVSGMGANRQRSMGARAVGA